MVKAHPEEGTIITTAVCVYCTDELVMRRDGVWEHNETGDIYCEDDGNNA